MVPVRDAPAPPLTLVNVEGDRFCLWHLEKATFLKEEMGNGTGLSERRGQG